MVRKEGSLFLIVEIGTKPMTLTERCFFGSVRKMSANGRLPSNVDPTIAQTTNECHRPLTRPRISNPVSVITAAETRRRREREEMEVLKGKHGSAAAGGRFRSDPFPESRLPNVNFGRPC